MTSSAEYAAVRKGGNSAGGKFVVVAHLGSPPLGNEIKAGFITSKKVGNAVTRNLVRRRLKAIIQSAGERIRPGRYLVSIARFRAAEASFQELEADWHRAARRAGALIPENAAP
jgi:ribonuclease P protein component